MKENPLTNAELTEIAAQVMRGERPQSDLEKYGILIGQPEEISIEEFMQRASAEETAMEQPKPVYVKPTPGERGMTLLHYAAYCNDPDAVFEQLLLGTPVDIRDDGGWTPLHWSIDMSQAWGKPAHVVSILLEHGASANAADKSGFTVIRMACDRSNEDILRQLIDAGADIRERTAGSTLLHEAAGSNFHEAVSILLALGIDPAVVNDRGDTAEKIAERCGFDETVAVLRAARLGT